MAKSPNRLMSALVCAVLIIGLTVPAQAAETPFADAIRVGSYKGNALNIGEISGLIISSGTASCTAVSDAPAVVSVANVLGHWTATAQGPGTATITVTASDGRMGCMTITVASAIPTDENGRDSARPTANTEVRQELVRLINQTRRVNGVAELPVNDALMDASQVCSDRLYTWHHTQEECEVAAVCGYPYGFGSNLTVFTGAAREDIAQRAVSNWINSPGHFQTMIDPDADSIGVGITESGGVTYCYMFVGKPDSINPYG